jgi:predicted RNase H-like HicB family nuclease
MMTITPEFHRKGTWIAAFCPEVPEAIGQGETEAEALAILDAAIALVSEDQRKGPW